MINKLYYLFIIDINEGFPLEKGWNSHKYGQRGSGKHITSKVRTYLEGFFLARNVNKADRMSAKDMAMELKKLVKEGEIQNEEIPEIKTIEERYSANLRRESAERRVENNETNKRSENCSENIQQK